MNEQKLMKLDTVKVYNLRVCTKKDNLSCKNTREIIIERQIIFAESGGRVTLCDLAHR